MADIWWQRTLDFLYTPAGYLGLGTAALVSAASTAYLLTRPQPLDMDVDYDNQSVRMEGGIYACPSVVKNGELIRYFYEDVKTGYEAFLRGKRISGNHRCLGARPGPGRQYEWITYNQAFSRVQDFGSGLFALGLRPGQNTNLGIFSTNRPEWVIVDQTCSMFSMVTVALYDTLDTEALSYVINLCEIEAVVCDTEAHALMLIKERRQTKSLKIVIVIEEVTQELLQTGVANGVKVMHFTEVENLGEKNFSEPMAPKPSDIVTICFTSGTTGNPKGVVLTHENIISDIASVTERFSEKLAVRNTDAHLSYLPLAHMYERASVLNVLMNGARIGFFSRDILLLFDDMQALHPTSFPAVPRILNKIRDKVLSSTEGSAVKSFLLRMGLSRKLEEVKRHIIRKNGFWDRLVFSKIHALLGGQVRYVSTGSAPLSKDVFDFTRCAFGCLVFEGYGQTECTAAVTITLPGDSATGHVGSPLACNYLKLVDVPEMEYYAHDGIGEVCVKGTNVMKEYYRNPEKTAEVFTSDGWLRTGDVGFFNKNGTLQIVDRCKHIFKLSQGEYIAPERIEAIYTRSKFVQQCFVDGDSLKSRCVAIVVPESDMIALWAENSKKTKDPTALCQDQDLKKVILQDMLQTGRSAELKGFEQVGDIELEPTPFSMGMDLITPTFKNKRPKLRKHFAHRVAGMYARQSSKAK